MLLNGVYQEQAGELEAAQAAYARVIAAAKPGADDKVLVWAKFGMGGIEQKRGNLGAALATYHEAETIADRLAKSDPGNAGWQSDLSASYQRICNVQVAQHDLAAAMASCQASHTIVARLAKSDPGNARWQRDLAMSYKNVGDVYVAQGKPAFAMGFYQADLAITERLAKSDPSNAGRQHDLSASYERVGYALMELSLPAAFDSYQASLDIRERLAKSDPGNAGWQRELSISYDEIANVERAQGNLSEALKTYRDSLAIAKVLIAKDGNNAQWRTDLQYIIGRIGSMAHSLVLARDFKNALEAADEAISLTPGEIWLYTNKAHALMFLGRVDEARTLYVRYHGEMNVQGKSWDASILEDFAELRKAGLTNPLMDEIEKLFSQ